MNFEEIVKKCKIEIQKSTNEKIEARAKVDLVDPPVSIKGFTIRRGIDKESSKECLYVLAPSFPNRFGKNSSIIWMPDNLWHLLTKEILSQYVNKVKETEEISLDDPIFEDLL